MFKCCPPIHADHQANLPASHHMHPWYAPDPYTLKTFPIPNTNSVISIRSSNVES